MGRVHRASRTLDRMVFLRIWYLATATPVIRAMSVARPATLRDR